MAVTPDSGRLIVLKSLTITIFFTLSAENNGGLGSENGELREVHLLVTVYSHANMY